MTLTTECKQGHVNFAWGCKECINKLTKIVWEINGVGSMKAKC